MTAAEEKTKTNKENLLKALEKCLGVVSDACKQAKVSRNCFYEYVREDAVFAAAVEEIKEVSLDFVESKMFAGIRKGDRVLIIFYLKCRGKKRGYVDTNIEEKSDESVKSEIYIPENGRD